MSIALPRLVLLEYDAQALADTFVGLPAERVIDDAEVERLLLGTGTPSADPPSPAAPVGDLASLRDVEDEAGAGLAPARGLLIGLALVLPLWGLVVAAAALL